MPKGVRDFLPKFNGDGKTLAEDHISTFKAICGTVDVPSEDVPIRLFTQNFTDAAANWFTHLPNASITNWNTMVQAFEARFKTPSDENSLLI